VSHLSTNLAADACCFSSFVKTFGFLHPGIRKGGVIFEAEPPLLKRFSACVVHTLKLSASTSMRYPVVEFSLSNGGKLTLLTMPNTFKVKLPTGEAQVSGSQIQCFLLSPLR
jgi:hypothetical protein